MLNPTPVYRTPRFWRRFTAGLLILLWIASFYQEIWLVITYLAGGAVPPVDPMQNARLNRAFLIFSISFYATLIYFLISLWLASQFVLPVRTRLERRLIFERLLRYMFGLHGPAVFIREGKIIGTASELKKSLPGVAFVDPKSAIVLEPQTFLSEEGGSVSSAQSFINQFLILLEKLLRGSQSNLQSQTRAAGPGLVFTGAGERIRGVVSLRQHIRVQPNVRATTLDGFEVAATVVAIFTLGEPPEVVRVGYCVDSASDPNPFRPENIRTIQVSGGQIRSFSSELDLQDQREVHVFALRAIPETTPGLISARPGQRTEPFLFDKERVFRAIYSDARRPVDDSVESWFDLPLRVAIEAYNNMISRWRYSDLYTPDDPEKFPLNSEFRPQLGRTVRNQGVLAFQFVRRKDGRPFVRGEAWNEAELDIFPQQNFRSSKVLRDRGIRMTAASVSEISPVNPMVRQQLLDFWRSERLREADIARAFYDGEEIRVRAIARVMAQKDIVNSLSQIMEDGSITSEAMAFKVLQSIEQFAKDPATEKLLPHEAISMLTNMHDWVWKNPPQPRK